MATSPDRIGWTPEPASRGTFSILASAFFTIFLLTYISLHIDIPPPSSSSPRSPYRSLFRGIAYTTGALLAPELLASYAFFDYLEARRLTHWMASQDLKSWTNTHSFFLLMGGFSYSLPITKPSFSKRGGILGQAQIVDIDNLGRLVAEPTYDFDAITTESVREKGRSDVLVRVLAVVQAVYMLVRLAGRLQMGLGVACVEVVGCAYVPLMVLSYCFWWDKVSIPSPSFSTFGLRL